MSAPSPPEGTYRAMIDKLDHLVATGITALELMPLADFAGRRGWGYDGVLWYAPDSAYGRPEDLKTLIDEAHLRGLMVFLDVVYNHFGPEGNYLGRYAPAFFTDAHTPWGSAIDYRVPQVRAFAVENALSWLARLSLRRPAAGCRQSHHGDPGRAVDAARSQHRRRPACRRPPAGTSISCWRTATTAPACSMPREEPPNGKYRAQWNDDYHHVWHVMLTGELARLLRRLPERRAWHLAARSPRASSTRAKPPSSGASKPRGEPSGELPPATFVNFLQNHDQIGNRPLGDRLESLAIAAADRSRARGDPARTDDADAVHGRGMGLHGALPVLLRFPGRPCRCRAQGAAAGICLGLREIRRRGPGSARSGDAAIGRARLDRPTRRSRMRGWRWCESCSRFATRRSCRASKGARFGDAEAGRERPAHRALAHGRRHDVAPDRQSLGQGHRTSQQTLPGTPIWGADQPAIGFRPGR